MFIKEFATSNSSKLKFTSPFNIKNKNEPEIENN
jgi:hypothetical protein